MVCDAFHPQIQAILCNYAAAARELNISEAAGDSLENCECRGALWKPDDACFSKDGHLLTIDTRKLRWPYLRKIVERGKKFRLQCDMDTVFAELRHLLDCYVTWSARGDEERLEKLEDWADAVYKRCKANWERKVQESPSHLRGPKGYPGLRRTIQEAHKSLVFLLDDRAPHGLVVVCKRWYQKEMAKYLADNTVFEDKNISWANVVATAQDFNKKWGFPTGDGVVYNYGIWKPTKGRFRFIAGTRCIPREERAQREERDEGGCQPECGFEFTLAHALGCWCFEREPKCRLPGTEEAAPRSHPDCKLEPRAAGGI